jgi:hypothetical protein
MRHCSTQNYWPEEPGYTTVRARQKANVFLRHFALNHHLEQIPRALAWGGQFETRARVGSGPTLVTVTRCKNGHLTTVMHDSSESYPRP